MMKRQPAGKINCRLYPKQVKTLIALLEQTEKTADTDGAMKARIIRHALEYVELQHRIKVNEWESEQQEADEADASEVWAEQEAETVADRRRNC